MEQGRKSKQHAWFDASEAFAIFPTMVWKVQLKADLHEGINEAIRESLHAKNPRLAELTPGETWQSDHQLQSEEAYVDLVPCIMNLAGTVLHFLKIGHRDIQLTGCWANVSARGASHAMHAHPNNYLSGVYYVQTSPGADTVNFHDPRPQASVIRPPVTELTTQNTDQVVVQVSDGTLLMFPSWLSHSVASNDSHQPRISISFNLMYASFAEKLSKPLWDPTPDRTR